MNIFIPRDELDDLGVALHPLQFGKGPRAREAHVEADALQHVDAHQRHPQGLLDVAHAHAHGFAVHRVVALAEDGVELREPDQVVVVRRDVARAVHDGRDPHDLVEHDGGVGEHVADDVGVGARVDHLAERPRLNPRLDLGQAHDGQQREGGRAALHAVQHDLPLNVRNKNVFFRRRKLLKVCCISENINFLRAPEESKLRIGETVELRILKLVVSLDCHAPIWIKKSQRLRVVNVFDIQNAHFKVSFQRPVGRGRGFFGIRWHTYSLSLSETRQTYRVWSAVCASGRPFGSEGHSRPA